jgi:hypothetical protein
VPARDDPEREATVISKVLEGGLSASRVEDIDLALQGCARSPGVTGQVAGG